MTIVSRLLFRLLFLKVATSSNSIFPSLISPCSWCSSKTKRLKVFVLAGQSNMEGHGEIDTTDDDGNLKNGTLLYQVHDPRTRKEFQVLWDEKANDWVTRSDVKVWFNEAPGGQDGVNGSTIPGIAGKDYSAGDLRPGFGQIAYGPFFGPELGFGFNLDKGCCEKVLIIKTAWGGKSIAHDFRPPSSAGTFDPFCQVPDCNPFQVGHFYQVMIEDVRKIMKPGVIGKMFPDLVDLYPELSGFAWHQGWNDGCNVNDTAAYETNMVNLIKDLRREWKNPHLPISIAVSGFGGFATNDNNRIPADCWDGPNATKVDCKSCGNNNDKQCRRIDTILSQFGAANITKHPELECCVEAMETRGFYREPEYSPNQRQDYHWYHNGETHYLVGKALAVGMNQAMKQQKQLSETYWHPGAVRGTMKSIQ